MLMSTYTNSAVVLLLIVFSKADAWWRRRHRSSPPSPPPRDTTPPEFSNCPSRWTVRVAATSTKVTWTEPTARDDRPVRRKRRICDERYDDCSIYPGYAERRPVDHYAVTPSRSGPPPGSTFTEGQHSIVYTARDLAGNTATCTVRFTVVTIRCPLIGSSPQRSFTCSNGNIETSTCTFSCATRYRLVGSSSVECRRHYGINVERGSWSGNIPTCRFHECGEPRTPDFGSKSCTSYNYGGRCSFRCRIGYGLSGSGLSSITCLKDSWNGTPPSCRDTQAPTFSYCPEDIIVANSDRVYSAVVTYTLPSAIDNSGLPPSIRRIHGPRSGEKFFSGRNFIRYRATDLNGNSADCTFSVTVRAVHCPSIPFQEGRRSICRTLKGDTCKFVCESGYTISGAATILCGANGSWDSEFPDCIVTTCDTLSPPSHGRITGCRRGSSSMPVTGPHPFGTTCDIACNTGYILSSGRESLTCISNGQWNTKRPVCSAIACALSTLPVPRHGKRFGCVSNMIALGEGCYLSCDRGYHPTAPILRTCQDDGSGQGIWSGGPITCSYISCNILSAPPNGAINGCYRGQVGRPGSAVPILGPHLYHTRCYIRCNTGYTLTSGSATRTCLVSGEWNEEEPVCNRTD